MDTEGGKSKAVVAVVTEPRFTQQYREYLEKQQLLDGLHRVEKMPDGTVAIPVLGETLPEQHLRQLRNHVAPGSTCLLTQLPHPVPSKKAQACSPARRLCLEVSRWVQERGVTWTAELEADLPQSWQRHGNFLLLSENCFQAKLWKNLEPELWETVASALGVQRLGKRGRVSPDSTRTPAVTLLLGDHGWVEHVDNGIRYKFDVTQCMFSFGNITEKLRVASLPCAGEVLVDLYAGIGYFTLPFLVHARAAFVHACEWNPHAVVALRKNLEINGVADRCQIHFGDNRKLKLSNIADRVNLGLIPSSEEGWLIACQVLRQDVGGILHIHQNVESFQGKSLQPPGSSEMEEEPWPYPQQIITNQWKNGATRESGRKTLAAATKPEWRRWAESAETCIASLLQQVHKKPWKTQILHIQLVKSYAPHVDHIVLDLECCPVPKLARGVLSSNQNDGNASWSLSQYEEEGREIIRKMSQGATCPEESLPSVTCAQFSPGLVGKRELMEPRKKDQRVQEAHRVLVTSTQEFVKALEASLASLNTSCLLMLPPDGIC